MIGAKKLTWKTSRQTCIGVSIEFMRLPSFSFGEMPALLTSALKLAAMRLQPVADLRDGDADILLIGEIDLDMVLRAGRPGQSSAKAWREQVMTRQPSREKRLTVAWPMPRLAPVRTIVFRVSSLAVDGLQPAM